MGIKVDTKTDKTAINELMDTTMQKVKEMIDANTIIGEPITTADGTTIIPVSKLSLGFCGAGTDFTKKHEPSSGFGGGIGAGVKIEPVVFIVIIGESVKLLRITPPSETTLDRIIETVPEVIDKVSEFIKKDKD